MLNFGLRLAVAIVNKSRYLERYPQRILGAREMGGFIYRGGRIVGPHSRNREAAVAMGKWEYRHERYIPLERLAGATYGSAELESAFVLQISRNRMLGRGLLGYARSGQGAVSKAEDSHHHCVRAD